ncbi:MAG: FMN-binding protein [Ignavibacteriota bacterium]|nr:FMN-binding protein [Ignavibacterium album]QKK00562.1 MAG: FMN-binding protein [Ignavibacteriota bacterium]HOJ08138.1 FMN-binding protein [Ignavibacteriaceae bacterium]
MKQIVVIIAALTIIGVIAGGSLSLVNNWAAPKIALNLKAETERAIFLVHLDGKRYEEIKEAGFEVYKVYNEKDSAVGYSLVYDGNGFQGKIKLMIGLTEDLNKTTSIEILEQSETPGLGTKILEPPYKDQYNGLDVNPSVKLVKGAEPSNQNEVQSITGATISSRAVVIIVNEGIAKLKSIENKGASK